MNTEYDMYKLAIAKAIKAGPRTAIIDGVQLSGYMLEKQEVIDLFKENHYAIRRSTWKDHVKGWTDYDVKVPKKSVDNDSVPTWWIVFGWIDKANHKKLRMFAEDNDTDFYPQLAEGLKA